MSCKIRELISQARAGDTEALNLLINEYRPYLCELARHQMDSVVNTRVDASDIVQQTCTEMYRDFALFRGTSEAELVGWVKRILKNNVVNTYRDNVHAKKRSLCAERRIDNKDDSYRALGDRIAGSTSTPSAKAVRRETSERIEALLSQLPDDQQEAVRRRHLEGWSLEELASHFDRSQTAVAGLLKRGMRKLRQLMADEQE